MKRRVLSVLLAAALLVNTQAFSVLAKDSQPETDPVQSVRKTGEETEEASAEQKETTNKATDERNSVNVGETSVEESVYIDDEDLPDSEELLEGYFQQQLMEELYGGISTFGNYGVEELKGTDKTLYEKLKKKIESVASGDLESTEFTFTAEELGMNKPLKATDLGVASLDTEVAKTKLMAYWLSGMGTIYELLLVNTPYEMFWHDKTETDEGLGALKYGMSWAISKEKQTVCVNQITAKFAVAKEYSKENKVGTYTVDTNKVETVNTAVNTVKNIVKANVGKSDYQKLKAYCEKICELVDYNTDAANNTSMPYGNPWQLIWVFDNNPGTKVVCEGYSKAFQYLCDLSTFKGNVTCYTVTGDLVTSGKSEGHMWNIVSIGGKNYLVDVTNSDSNGMERLFMRGSTGSVDKGYTSTNFPSAKFVYDSETKALYSKDILTLSEEPYTEPVQTVQTLTSVSISTNGSIDLAEGYTSGPVLTSVPGFSDGDIEPTDITYQWMKGNERISNATGSTYTVPNGLAEGEYEYKCKVTAGDKEVVSKPVKVTVKKTSIANAVVTVPEMTYNGKDQTLNLTVKVGEKDLIKGTDYEISGDSTIHDAKEYKVTLTGKGTYTGTKEIPVNVAKKELTPTVTGNLDKEYDRTTNAPDGLQLGLTGVCNGDDVQVSAGTKAYDSADAGQRTLKISGIQISGAQAGNYELAETEVSRPATITQKDIQGAVVTLDSNEFVYNGQEQTKNVVSVVLRDKSVTTYNVTGNTAKDAGKHTLTVTGTGNYTGKVTKEYTIAPASFTYAVSDQTVKIGNGLDTVNVASQASGVSGEMVDGTLTWFADEGRTQELQNYVFEGSAGSQTTLYWRFTPAAGQTNYKSDSVERSTIFTLQEKAVPVLDVKDYVKDYNGKAVKLSDVVSNVSAKVDGQPVEGTWNWNVDDGMVNAGQYPVTLTFTPNDSKNLATASKNIQVTINQLPMEISMVVATTEIQVFRPLPEVRLVYNGKTAEGESLISSVGTLFKWTNSNTNISGSTVVSLANEDKIRADVEGKAAGNYNITWKLSPITVTIKAIETPVSGLDETKYTVKVDGLNEAELNALPEEYRTEKAVSDKLMDTAKEMLKKGDDVFKHAIAKPQSGWKAEIQGSLLFSAELMKKEEQSQWMPVDAEEFPDTGISFKVAYPAGTSKATHAFAAIHMIMEKIDGNEPGDTELLKITLENDGIVIHMNSCSPVLLVWSEAPKAAAQTDVTKPSDNKTDAANTTNTAKTTGNKAAQTGDTANTALYLFLLVLSGGGATAAVWSKKRYKA